MTDSPEPTVAPFDPRTLPRAVARYLTAQDDRAARARLADLFTADARVIDEGVAHDGRTAIDAWLRTAATAYSYTTAFTGQRQDDAAGERWSVEATLRGDFPGGVARVAFRFRVHDGLIVKLHIG